MSEIFRSLKERLAMSPAFDEGKWKFLPSSKDKRPWLERSGHTGPVAPPQHPTVLSTPSPVSPAAPACTPGNPPMLLIQDRVKGSSFSQEQHMFPTNAAFIASHYNCLAACALRWAECILIYLNE